MHPYRIEISTNPCDARRITGCKVIQFPPCPCLVLPVVSLHLVQILLESGVALSLLHPNEGVWPIIRQPSGLSGQDRMSREPAMTETDWTPWKMTTFGFLLVGATALVTTLIMGFWADREDAKQSRAASRANASARKALVPSQVDGEACQAYAQRRTEDKRMDADKEVAVGGVAGAITGTRYVLNGTRRHDAQYQAAFHSCMRQKGY